jgi:two-component system chemotaxis response regulator CheY
MTHTTHFGHTRIGPVPPQPVQRHRAEGQVATINAEDALAAMLENIQPTGPGWRAMLLAIPGHVSETWRRRPVEPVVHSLLRKALSVECIAHVYLLADNTIAVLTHDIDALLLPGLEQAFIRTFQRTPGDTLVNRYDLSTQLEEVLGMVNAKRDQQRRAKAEAEQHAALARQEALRFSIPVAELAARPYRQHKIVLLVEDDPFTAALLTGLTNHAGATVVAKTAADAVKQYRAHVPDLVFLDIGLPDVNGLTLLKHLRAADAGARVVILTANAYRENLDKARASGVEGFVVKPFTRNRIQRILNTLNNRKH